MNEVDYFNENEFEIITKLVRKNKIKKAKKYIKTNKIKLAMAGNIIFKECSVIGNLKFIKYLLKKKEVIPFDNNNRALFHASLNGNFQLVKLYLEKKNSLDKIVDDHIIESILNYKELKDSGLVSKKMNNEKRLKILNLLYNNKKVKSLINAELDFLIKKELEIYILKKKLIIF
jgi:hypothetical protein